MSPKYSTCRCCCSSRNSRFENRNGVSKRSYRIRRNARITVKQFIVNALETVTDYIRAVLSDSAGIKLSDLERFFDPLSVGKIQTPSEKVRSWIRDSFAIKPSRDSSSSSSSNESKSIKHQRKRRGDSVKEKRMRRSQSPVETITLHSSSSVTEQE